MTLGTLRDQVIYPHTRAEMQRRSNIKDDDLRKFLDLVQLTHLLDRENVSNSEGQGWDAVADWMDVLSGGEKQRIAVSPVCSLNSSISRLRTYLTIFFSFLTT